MNKRLNPVIKYFLKNPGLTLSHAVETIRCCHQIVPFYSPKYPLVLSRGIRLLMRGFHADESLSLGLLSLDFPMTDLHRFVGRGEMSKIEEALNPEPWRVGLFNKSLFYMHCDALGLPCPRLYAIFIKGHVGHTSSSSILKNQEDWEGFFKKGVPAEFLIKPTIGSYGGGIMVFRRLDPNEFVNVSTGDRCNAGDLYHKMFSSSHGSFIIQEWLKSHGEIVRMSGSESLQTLRVWTYVDNDGSCNIIYAFFKPIVGNNVVDNHRHGETGNLVAEVCLDDGTIKSAVKMIPNTSGLTTISRHPDTGCSFKGFTIPLWDEVCKLAEQAALRFLPLRLVGWDIGVTPEGPYMIEGNWNGDPPSFNGTMDIMLARVRKDRLS